MCTFQGTALFQANLLRKSQKREVGGGGRGKGSRCDKKASCAPPIQSFMSVGLAQARLPFIWVPELLHALYSLAFRMGS